MRPQESGSATTTARRSFGRLAAVASLVLTAVIGLTSLAAGAQESEADEPVAETTGEEETIDPVLAAQLQQGSQVYSQICSACHQPGGTGLPGQYPPLIDNPNVDDTQYMTDVINNGRQGEIVVQGETYDGVMPAFSTLSDEDTAAVIAFIQNDFVAPVDEHEVAIVPTGPTAGTELPALTNIGAIVAYLVAASVAALVLTPRLISENDRLNTPWLDAGLKTAVIVFGVVFLTIVVPDWALKTSAVSKLDQIGQDLIGLSLWGGGLVFLLWALWYAHRDSRI